LIIGTQGYSQISPGIMAKAHAELEGLRNCTKCHRFGDRVTNKKCLDCHIEIKSRIKQNKGYHASSEVKGKKCYDCHDDHLGLDFELVRLDTDTFNHKLADYELLGKHAEVECQACHKKEFIIDSKILELNNTYLGLGQECLSCHVDYHQGTLSNNCAECHDYDAFKPALGFDHSKTNYPLEGKHINTDCQKCHVKEVRNGQEFQRFSDVKFESCTDCHEDIHREDLGQNCAECHTFNSFIEIKDIENFSHDLTIYPLEGAHQKVECKVCHTNKMTDVLAHENCTDCHEDYHKNDPGIQMEYPDCRECHNLDGFTPSLYIIDMHNESAFPLKGAHLATPCFSCHLDDKEWKLRGIGSKCIDCHEDSHKGIISEEYYPEQDCEACHIENKWSEIQFDHNLTEYELIGAHKEQDCRACHFSNNEAGDVVQNFTSFNDQCTDCHDDIHYQQFDKDGVTDCVQCHSPNQWTIPDFDHSNSLYPLDGAHERVSCDKCHNQVTNRKGSFIIYKIKEFKCEDCHS